MFKLPDSHRTQPYCGTCVYGADVSHDESIDYRCFRYVIAPSTVGDGPPVEMEDVPRVEMEDICDEYCRSEIERKKQ